MPLRPAIPPDHYANLFENNRYYIVDFASRIADHGIEKKQLLDVIKEANPTSNSHVDITASVIRRVRRIEPIKLSHAIAIVNGLDALISKKRKNAPPLDPDHEVVGAFFTVPKLEEIFEETRDVLSKPLLAQQMNVEASVIEDMIAGRRVTLATALALLRVLNGVRRAKKYSLLHPGKEIRTSHKEGKRAAAKKCLAKQTNYAVWPPENLEPEDAID